jgi:hypothetical protein
MPDLATIALLQERSIARAESLTEQLQGALNSRIIIEQAKGALATRHDVSVDQAFEMMRRRARTERRRLSDVARGVLDELSPESFGAGKGMPGDDLGNRALTGPQKAGSRPRNPPRSS